MGWGPPPGLNSNTKVGEGVVGALEGETSNFAWGQSKIGLQEVTLDLGREGRAESLPSGEAVARLHSR